MLSGRLTEAISLSFTQDFENALPQVRASVSLNELGIYEEWNKQFGSLSL